MGTNVYYDEPKILAEVPSKSSNVGFFCCIYIYIYLGIKYTSALFLGNWSWMPKKPLCWQINFLFIQYFKQEKFIIHIPKLKELG